MAGNERREGWERAGKGLGKGLEWFGDGREGIRWWPAAMFFDFFSNELR